jgi:hypothetical protein
MRLEPVTMELERAHNVLGMKLGKIDQHARFFFMPLYFTAEAFTKRLANSGIGLGRIWTDYLSPF